MPSGITTDKPPTLSPAIQEVLGILSNAEQLFLSDLQLLARRGRVSHVRDAAVSLAVITALRSSLGAPNPGAPTLAAKLLGESQFMIIDL
jgi:separase